MTKKYDEEYDMIPDIIGWTFDEEDEDIILFANWGIICGVFSGYDGYKVYLTNWQFLKQRFDAEIRGPKSKIAVNYPR